ncbi:Bax inhibitor-1/YccA family protein [Nakamurella endophytica]|uniref:Membrane protein n=1 Tax=Nakamurella endophytica TaxID=1748367 RepID=A0A917SM34_9ACTN|nr:Bax inhibitor-1/YccA family protein [Nakamurella endophytica]GGL87148.1 membrane protein [Nakamurella endophytica]
MQSSNPAFRNLGQAPGGNVAPPPPSADYLQQMYNQPSTTAPARERFLTLDDVVAKTATVLGVGIVAAILTMYFSSTWVLALPALLVGFVLSLVIIFKQSSNPALILTYAVAEGIFLGAITGVFESIPNYQGIGLQALVGTLGVFAGMLVVYKTGAIRVTPKFTKFLLGAMIGVVVLVLFNLVMSLFGVNTHLRDGSPLAMVISVVIIAIAALSFLLDFDQIDRAIKGGAPARMAWYFAFGLMVTLVWLYLEILRFLSYLRD